MSSHEGRSVLAGFCDHCPGCNQDFSFTADSLGSRTYLSCGHSMCLKCVQTEWCNSTSNDLDLVNCPICNIDVFINFEKNPVEVQPIDQPRHTPSFQHVQIKDEASLLPVSGCSDVLISQSTNDNQSTFPLSISNSLPELDTSFNTSHFLDNNPTLSIADSIIDMVEMHSAFPAPEQPDTADDRSWSMDILTFHDMLENNDATQHLRHDNMFTEQPDSDMGTVQDILKIANINRDSLLDDNSLSAMFLQEPSNGSQDSRDTVKTSCSSSSLSNLSTSYNNLYTTVGVPMDSNQGFELSQRHFAQVSDQQTHTMMTMLGKQNPVLEVDKYATSVKTRKRYARGGRKRNVLSRAATADSINIETMTAVASIEDQTQAPPPRLPERRLSEKLMSLKENLHDRFYPKTRLEPPRIGAMSTMMRYSDRVASHRQDEIDIPDMQMVKIVSDVQVPEKSDQQLPEVEESDNHNYGYVKNSMLPNGNEVKNLYVVPQQWLNKDEVACQFEPSQSEPQPEEHHYNDYLMEGQIDASIPLIKEEIPFEDEFFSDNLVEQMQRHKPPIFFQVPEQQNMDNMFSPSTETGISSVKMNAGNQQKTEYMNTNVIRADQKTQGTGVHENTIFHPSQIPRIVQSTTVAKSLLDHKQKVIKVWSQDDKQKSLGKEVQISQLPQQEQLNTSEHLETEMVRVRYEMNDGQIVFIPQDENRASQKAVMENDDKEPLLILTVNDNNLYLNSDSDHQKLDQSADAKTVKGTSVQTFNADTEIRKSDSVNKCLQSTSHFSYKRDSLDRSRSFPPSASNSNVSCQAMFSSPESVKAEDIQGWYSQNNSKEESNLEIVPWDEIYISTKSDPSCDISRTNSSHSSVVDVQGRDIAEQNHKIESSSDTSVTRAPATRGSCIEGTDYGSPPELEMMISVSRSDSSTNTVASDSRAGSVMVVTEVPSKPEGSGDGCFDKNELNVLIKELFELNQTNFDPALLKLICEMNKIKELQYSNREIKNERSQPLYNMIQNQIKSVLACAKAEHQLNKNSLVVSADTVDSIQKQTRIFSDAISNGIRMLVSLCSEFIKISSCHGNSDEKKKDPSSKADRDIERFSQGDNTENSQNDNNDNPKNPQNRVKTSPQIYFVEDKNGEKSEIQVFIGTEPITATASVEYPVQLTDADLENLKVKQSSSDTSVISKVSSIALNVEIDGSSSAESVLPSLSDVLKDNNIDQETTLTVITLKPNCHTRELDVGPSLSDDKENSNDQDSEDDEEEYIDDDKDEDFDPGNEIHFTRPRASRGKTLRRQCTDKGGSSTPKKKPRCAAGKGKPMKTGGKTGGGKKGKKKGGGKKDVEASSSEEIIPAPVKRGFQFTDECFKVFNLVYNHESSDSFCKEIKSDDVPGYYKVVKRAMWLDLIAFKLRTGKYETLDQYVADMRLVFENSRRFNKKDSEVYNSSLVCQKYFEKVLAEQFPEKHL